MRYKQLAQKIKNFRIRKGHSQEILAEKSGLSLRTIQRIENGETEPRGESLKRLAAVFGISPNELMDWTVEDNQEALVKLNLSALSFIIFPILGILIPLVIWIPQKDKIRNLNELAKDLLNFQITWTMILFIGSIVIPLISVYEFNRTGDINAASMSSRFTVTLLFFALMYLYNGLFIAVNSARLKKETSVKYYPKIAFLR